MDKERIEIAARLREARANAGFEDATQTAAHFKWPVIAYRSHENAHRGLKASVASRYAKAFNVRLDWLLTGELPQMSFGLENEISKLPKEQQEDFLKSWRDMLNTVKIKRKNTS